MKSGCVSAHISSADMHNSCHTQLTLVAYIGNTNCLEHQISINDTQAVGSQYYPWSITGIAEHVIRMSFIYTV